MELIGYKSFNKGLINRCGKKLEVGKIYIATGAIKFGNGGNGYHLCKNIEDTFRYYSNFKNDIDVCLVKGSGDFCKCEDKCYDDVYCFEQIQILKKLTHDEIIELGLNLDPIRAERFVSTFKLNLDEISVFKNKYKNYINIISALACYQENNKNIYEEAIKRYTRI